MTSGPVHWHRRFYQCQWVHCNNVQQGDVLHGYVRWRKIRTSWANFMELYNGHDGTEWPLCCTTRRSPFTDADTTIAHNRETYRALWSLNCEWVRRAGVTEPTVELSQLQLLHVKAAAAAAAAECIYPSCHLANQSTA